MLGYKQDDITIRQADNRLARRGRGGRVGRCSRSRGMRHGEEEADAALAVFIFILVVLIYLGDCGNAGRGETVLKYRELRRFMGVVDPRGRGWEGLVRLTSV